jgi:hypothetical protein
VRTGRNQRERHAGVGPADRLRQQPHSAAVLQNFIGQGVQGRFGVSGVELCDDHHTFLPFFCITLPPVLGPLSRGAWSGEEPFKRLRILAIFASG